MQCGGIGLELTVYLHAVPFTQRRVVTLLRRAHKYRHLQATALLERLQQKPYRRKQIRKWVYECGVTDFQAMTNLPKALQAKLLHEVASGSMEVEPYP